MADLKQTGAEVQELLNKIPDLEKLIGSHNKELKFFAIEPVTVRVGEVEHQCAANEVATVFVGDEEFEVIPTSNNSIQSLLSYPIPLTWYDWLDGVEVFNNIVFDMNELDTYKHWIQYYQGDYRVQKAQYVNCVFWSDKPYTHSPFEERTNYTIYYSAQLPLCYSTIPANTYKPFYLAYGVNTDPNWQNPDYVASYAAVSGATQTFSYYGANAIGIFDMAVDIITLPKDCRGLMYHAPALSHAGVFDAINTTNFGAKKGSWQEAFGDCYSLEDLFIQNLKASINISWSPINNESMAFIVENAANTSAITISVSPYTYYRLTDEIKAAATAKNITIALIEGNLPDDRRWGTKQDTIEDLQTIRENAAKGATAVQSSSLATVATSGSYNDLTDKPTIPTVPTNVSEFENDAQYITEEEADGKYQPKGEGGDTQGSVAYPLVNHGTSDATFELTPNVMHVWDEMSALTLTLGEEVEGVVNEYVFQFVSGAVPTTLTLPSSLVWANVESLFPEAAKVYQVSIINGKALSTMFSFFPSNRISVTLNSVASYTITSEKPVTSDIKVNLSYTDTKGVLCSEYATMTSGSQQVSGITNNNTNGVISISSIEPASDATYKYTF